MVGMYSCAYVLHFDEVFDSEVGGGKDELRKEIYFSKPVDFSFLTSFCSCRYRTVLLNMKENILVLQKVDIDGKMTNFYLILVLPP